MAHRRQIPKFFVTHRVDRWANHWTWQDCLNAVRQNCLGTTFLRRNKTWYNSKYKTLGTQVESRRCSTTTKSTTWFCSSKTRMQTNCTRNVWKRLNKKIDQFLVINNHDNEEGKHSKELTSSTIESILGGSIVQSHRETCRIRLRQHIGTVTIGRRKVGILGNLRGLTIRDFSLSLGPISVARR